MQLNGREFTLYLAKDFPGFSMYKSDEEFRGTPVLNGVYIPKAIFQGQPPEQLVVTIEVPRRLGF